MVSINYYLSVFEKVMPLRLEEIRRIYQKKLSIDEEIEKSKFISPQQVADLKQIVGEDHFFSTSEKRKDLETFDL